MRQNEAIAQGVCPMCFGQQVIWKALVGSSAWCSCCGGTGVYPPPQNSHGDGIYELDTSPEATVQLKKRESRYRVKQEDKLDAARKRQQELRAKPNNADGDYSGIRSAISKLDPK